MKDRSTPQERTGGVWTVSVAEAPHDSRSYNLYIKTPAHNYTLTRTPEELADLDASIRKTVPAGYQVPAFPIINIVRKVGKRRSAFFNALTRLSRKRSATSNTASPLVSPSPGVEKADPFQLFAPPPRPPLTELAAYLTTVSNAPVLRQTRAFKRFIHVRSDDLESARTERPLKRMRPNIPAMDKHETTPNSAATEHPTASLNETSSVEEVETTLEPSSLRRAYRSHSAAARISRTRPSSPVMTTEARDEESTTDSSSSSYSSSTSDTHDESPTPSYSNIQRVKPTKPISIEDFELMRVLGKGCAGKVFLVRKKNSEQLYALKAITKRHVIAHQELKHTLTEQAILRRLTADDGSQDGYSEETRKRAHPFLVKMWWSFHDRDNLFLVLDFHPGGDLATQLSRWGRLGRDRARFYAAEMVMALEALHDEGVIYRDLKPENVLIGRDGHIVLTDFGLAKEFPRNHAGFGAVLSTAPSTPAVRGRRTTSSSGGFDEFPWTLHHNIGVDTTTTFCGTAEYLAPEVIQGFPYSYPVDWWALGTLMYEMIIGIIPFWAQNQQDMYTRVLNGELIFPESKSMDEDTKVLLRGLLEKDPLRRLSSSEIKQQSYFSMIDWSYVHYKRYIPPFVPPMDPSTADDTQNFDHTLLDMAPVLDVSSTEPIAPVDNSLKPMGGSVEPPTSNGDLFDCYSYDGLPVDQPDCTPDPSQNADADSMEDDSSASSASTTNSAAQMSCAPIHQSPVAASLSSGEDEWDLVEQHGEEAGNGASEASLFSRGVVDKYTLAFRKSTASPPERSLIRGARPRFLRPRSRTSSKDSFGTNILPKLSLPPSLSSNRTALRKKISRSSLLSSPTLPSSPSLPSKMLASTSYSSDEDSREVRMTVSHTAEETVYDVVIEEEPPYVGRT
ncbi:kinase-like protein [Cylindrobasidium torrendii FP15055 ss-10]|uniref:Kinase-like protein n=1 Tax=Cylindrobasidium torrendii FP15055 ss-10 TaxID=1314674 RepID=A0A0D7BS03_9AGAR|nr:kinase-like protein [Cylindrobasidium torrendii FP15055 ss-10]